VNPRVATVALLALLVAIAALAFVQSYQRWLDPIIDTGRDLYIPEQLLHGAKLYRDIRYQYPPLAPYLLAAITAVIGHSLASYTAIGLAQSIVIAAALWIIGWRTAGAIAGFVAALFFIALSFCGASTWGANFLFPYSYGATIGMALLMISLASFLYERPILALTALFAASWCKVEYAVAAIVVVVILAFGRRISIRHLVSFDRGSHRDRCRDSVFSKSAGECVRRLADARSGGSRVLPERFGRCPVATQPAHGDSGRRRHRRNHVAAPLRTATDRRADRDRCQRSAREPRVFSRVGTAAIHRAAPGIP